MSHKKFFFFFAEGVIPSLTSAGHRVFFVADLKAILLNLGMKAANANDICIYCECPKRRWNLCTVDKLCKPRYRSVNEKLLLPSLEAGRPGYARVPLVNTEVYTFVILDNDALEFSSGRSDSFVRMFKNGPCRS